MKRNHIIGFDAKHANRGNTSQGSYARFIIEALAVACPQNSYFRMYIESEQEHSDFEALAEHHNVEAMLPDGLLWRKVSGLWRLSRVSHDLKQGGVELYHALSGIVPYGLQRRGIRSVATVHNLEFLRLRSLFDPLQNFYRRVMIYSSMCRADRIIAVSDHIKREIVRYFHIDPEKIDVIHLGCHRRFSEPITEEQYAEVSERYGLPERYLLVAGTQSEKKNLSDIIETMPMLDKSLHLVIAGRATVHTKHMLRRVESLGLGDRVHVLYGVAAEDMPMLYKGAEAYIMLSKYEGFSSTIVEAITVGVPVIAAKGSSLEEAGGPSSIYIDGTNREALASAIRSVVSDVELRERMIREGREFSLRFRHEVVAYNVINCYKRIGVDIGE